MNIKLENIFRYILLFTIFFISIDIVELNIVYYSIFLIYIVVIQLINYLRINNRIKKLLILLEFILVIYLSKDLPILFYMYSINLILDIIKYLDIKLIIILNILYSIFTLIYFNGLIDFREGILFVLGYIIIIFLGYLIRENSKIKNLKKEIDYLKYESKIREIENEKKDEILKDIYITKERNRMSRDIHDSVGHSLSAIIIQLSAIEKIAKLDGEKAGELSGNLREYAIKAMDDIRDVLKDNKPKDSMENELIVVIENLINENVKLTGLDIVFKFSANRYILDTKVEKLLYNGVKEFISNSIKHGDSTKIDINLFYKEKEIVLSMKDNGIGSDKLQKGMGLKSLEERVRENNGKVIIETSKGNGFLISIIIER